MTTNAGGVDGGRCWVPLQGAIVVWLWLAEAFFLYIDNAKIGFCAIWGSMAGIIFVCFYLESIWQPWGEFFFKSKRTWRFLLGLQMSAYEICWVGVSLEFGGYHHSWIEETTRRSSMRMPRNQLLWPTFAIYLKLYETRSTAQKFPVHGVRCSCFFSPHQVMRGTFFRVRKQVSTTFLNNFWTSPPFYWTKPISSCG